MQASKIKKNNSVNTWQVSSIYKLSLLIARAKARAKNVDFLSEFLRLFNWNLQNLDENIRLRREKLRHLAEESVFAL